MNHDDYMLPAAMLVLIDRLQHHMEIDAQSAAAGVSTDDEEAIAQARAALAANTFAHACHELADRARVVHGGNPGLMPRDLHMLRMLEASAHAVGDAADELPDLYVEPRA